MAECRLISFVILCTIIVTCSAHENPSTLVNITRLQRELKKNVYFSPHYCGMSQTLRMLAPQPEIQCGIRFRLLADTKASTAWYPVIETLPSFGRLWLLKTTSRPFDTPIDKVPWLLTEFTSQASVTTPEEDDVRSALYWEPNRNTPNQYMNTRNPDPSLRIVTPGVFKWYAEELLSKNRSFSQTMALTATPEREPPAPGGVGAMGNFNGVNNFVVLQPIPVGLKEMDFSMWIKCGAYANRQLILFAESQIPSQFSSDHVAVESCESQVLFSLFETSNIKISIRGGSPLTTGLSICNPNSLNIWHYLRVTMMQQSSSPSNSAADGLTLSVSVDLGLPFVVKTQALPLVMSKVSIGADTRCDSASRGICMDPKSRVVTCLQPFSGLLDEIRFFDKIRPVEYLLWEWKRGWSNYEIDFYKNYASIKTLFSLTFEELHLYGQSRMYGNGVPDYSPTIFPSTSPVFSFNQSFNSIEISAAQVPVSQGCGVDPLKSVVQFTPEFVDVQSISIKSFKYKRQPRLGCALTLKNVGAGFKEGNLIQELYVDPLYAYYGIYGSNAFRRVSLGSFYDTFVLEAEADLNSEKLSTFGLVTFISLPGISWDNSMTFSMQQDSTMIFSPRIFYVDYESVQVQIWTDPLPGCTFQVVSFDAHGNYVLGAVVKPGDYVLHPKLLLAFTPPRHKSYPKQNRIFAGLKFEFKVHYRQNPNVPILSCKVALTSSCNLGSFYIHVEPVTIRPSWTSDSLANSVTVFDIAAESRPVLSMLFEDADSYDFFVSILEYPSKGKLYEYSAEGGLGAPISQDPDIIIESWITEILDTSDSTMIKDKKSILGKFQLDASLVFLKKNVILKRGDTSILTFEFGNTPFYANALRIYGFFSEDVYVWVEGSNFGDALSKNDPDWFFLSSGYLQPANATMKNAMNFSSEVSDLLQEYNFKFCPQRLKSSKIFRFRFSSPSDNQQSFISSIYMRGVSAPPRLAFKSFEAIDASKGAFRLRFIYAAPLLFYGPIHLIFSLTDCSSKPDLRNVTFNILPKFFPAYPLDSFQYLNALAGDTISASFEGNSIQNSPFDIVYLGSDSPLVLRYMNQSLSPGSFLRNHSLFGAGVGLTIPETAGGFPYTIIRYGFFDNGVQSPYVGEISINIKCRVSYFHFQRKCLRCPVGHFCNETGLLEPNPCPIGRYSSTEGQIACKLCTPGYYTEKLATTNCFQCEKGTFNPEFGAAKCKLCEKGYFMAETGGTKCVLCPEGTYSESLGQEVCKNCPEFSNTDLSVLGDSIEKCKCRDGAFFNGKDCSDCCYGAACKGNRFQPAARTGFWTDYSLWPSKSCHFIQCDNIDDCKSQDADEMYTSISSSHTMTPNFSSPLQNLSSPYAASQSSRKKVTSNCDSLKTSHLCFSCETGYFKDSFGACHLCSDASVLPSFAWKMLVLITVSALFVYSCRSKVRCTYILYALLQNMCFISRLPLNWSSGARLPFSIAWIAFLKVDFLPLSCWTLFVPNTETRSSKEFQAFVYILGIPCILTLLWVFFVLLKLKNALAPVFRLTFQNLDLVNAQISVREWPLFYRILADEISPKRIEFWKRSAIHAVTMAFSNMMLVSSVSALDLLTCRNLTYDGSIGYLLLDPEVDCNIDSRQSIRYLLIFFILFSSVIYPAFCCIKIQLLHVGNHYYDEFHVHMYGHLYMRYKREVYWWEMVVLLKKSMLILAMGTFPDSTVLLVGSVLIVLSVSLLGTVYFKPYRSDLENEAELLALLSQILIVFAGLYFYSAVSFTPNKADATFFDYVEEVEILVWITAAAIVAAMFLFICRDSKQLFEETGVKSIFLRLISIYPQSGSAAQDRLIKTAFLECDADLMWKYGSSTTSQKMVTALEANSGGDQLNQKVSEFQNTTGAVALVQRQVLTVSSENKVLIAKIAKLEIHYNSLKEDADRRQKAAEDLENVTEEAKRAISFLETLKQDCEERVEKAQYWSEMLQSTRMQRQTLEKELLVSKKMERSQASLIRTVNSHFSKTETTKKENS